MSASGLICKLSLVSHPKNYPKTKVTIKQTTDFKRHEFQEIHRKFYNNFPDI